MSVARWNLGPNAPIRIPIIIGPPAIPSLIGMLMPGRTIGMLPRISPRMIPMKNQFVCIGKFSNRYVMILLNNNTPANSPIPSGRMNFHWDMIFFTFNEITSINLL